jgi:hypothetical protein
MSELQIALIGFGALLVAGVWGYNLWQERKHRRRAEAMLPADRAAPDVLMAGREEAPAERAEPVIDAPGAVPREPTFDAVPVAPPESEAASESAPVAPLPTEWADGRADCLLRVEFVDAVPGAELWAEQSAWADRIDKPVQWLGLDARSGRWRALLPQDQGAVTQLAAALQLVDRAGVVGEATLAEFLGGVHRLAQRFAGLVELPETAAVLARANELDAFCAGVDLQLALHVVPRQGSLNEMLGAKLRPVIEAGGLRLEGERYVAVDAAGAEVFSLVCRAATAFSPARLDAAALTDLLFSLDVPRVAAGAAGFERMIACARQCAEALGGQLVDGHGKPLADATIDAIRARIDELQAKMAAMDIPAGGVRALRLFA